MCEKKGKKGKEKAVSTHYVIFSKKIIKPYILELFYKSQNDFIERILPNHHALLSANTKISQPTPPLVCSGI